VALGDAKGVKVIGQAEVKVLTIGELLARFSVPQSIDYWSLAVGGQELNVLRSFPWREFKVKVLSVNVGPNSREIHSFLDSLGFVVPRLKPPNSDGYYVAG
jgi:hypothetical protein